MTTKLTTLAVAAAVALTACGGSSDETTELPRGSEPVELDPADFSAEIDNLYWPMSPGSRWVYRESGENGGVKRVVVTVLDRTKTVDGIEARVVHDVVTEDGERLVPGRGHEGVRRRRARGQRGLLGGGRRRRPARRGRAGHA
jgi:hypothetical protein